MVYEPFELISELGEFDLHLEYKINSNKGLHMRPLSRLYMLLRGVSGDKFISHKGSLVAYDLDSYIKLLYGSFSGNGYVEFRYRGPAKHDFERILDTCILEGDSHYFFERQI